jgi:hypothetical protein
MARITNSGSFLQLNNLSERTPIQSFEINVTPILQSSTDPSPDLPNILYDSRNIGLHIFNGFDSKDYNHIYFTQFKHPVHEQAMYYGRLKYDNYNQLLIMYTHTSIPGSAITWQGLDTATNAWHGTISDSYEIPSQADGYSENYKYVASYNDLTGSGYEFTIQEHDIYVYDSDYYMNEDKFKQRVNQCHFCYSIANRHIADAMDIITLPASRCKVKSEPYSCTITYDPIESISATKINTNNTTTYDLLADVATMTDTSDEKGFCILKQTPLPFPLKELHIQLPLVQEGEGTPSLDNPRPFKRYDSITIARPANGSFLFSLADVYKKMNTTDFTISEDGTITGTSLAFKTHAWNLADEVGTQVPIMLICTPKTPKIDGTREPIIGYRFSADDINSASENGAYPLVVSHLVWPNMFQGDYKIWFESSIGDDDAELSLQGEVDFFDIQPVNNQSTPPFEGTITLPKDTFTGDFEAIEGKLSSIYTYTNDYSISVYYNWNFINSNDCQAYWTNISPTTDSPIWAAALVLPPNIPAISTDNVAKNNSISTHFFNDASGTNHSQGGFWYGEADVNEDGITERCIYAMDTRFTSLETVKEILHNLDNPVYFALLSLQDTSNPEKDAKYVYSEFSKKRLLGHTQILQIKDYQYQLTYYTNSLINVTNMSDFIKEHTYDVMQPAASDMNGTAGLVPAPRAGNQNYFLRGDATWQELPKGSTYTGFTTDFGIVSGGKGLGTHANSPGILNVQTTWSSTPDANYLKNYQSIDTYINDNDNRIYSLAPIATMSTPGLVRIGSNILYQDGAINVENYGGINRPGLVTRPPQAYDNYFFMGDGRWADIFGALAPTYDANQSYSKGDIIQMETDLYQFDEDTQPDTAWQLHKISLSDLIVDLEKRVAALENNT